MAEQDLYEAMDAAEADALNAIEGQSQDSGDADTGADADTGTGTEGAGTAPQQTQDTSTTAKDIPAGGTPDKGGVITYTRNGEEVQKTVEELIEIGKKADGLDAKYTQRGQELAQQKAQFDAEMQRREEQMAARMQTALENVYAKRDETRLKTEDEKRQQQALEELKEVDPDKYELEMAKLSIRQELNEARQAYRQELDELKGWRAEQEQSAKLAKEMAFKAEVEDAAEKSGVISATIIGHMYANNEPDPYKVADILAKAKQAEIQAAVDAAMKGTAPNLAGKPRLGPNQTRSARLVPEGQKMPNILDEPEKLSELILRQMGEVDPFTA